MLDPRLGLDRHMEMGTPTREVMGLLDVGSYAANEGLAPSVGKSIKSASIS